MSDTDYLKYQRKLNALLAIPIYSYPKDIFHKTFKVYLMTAYQYISEIIVIVVTAAQLWAIPHFFDDMNVLCGCLSSGSHSLQVVVKTICLRLYKEQYFNHFKKTQAAQYEIDAFEMSVLNKTYAGFLEYQSKQSKYIRIIVSIQLLVNFLSTSAYFLPFVHEALIEGDKIEDKLLPIVVYIGVDYNFYPLYQIICITLTIGFYIVNLKCVVIDNFILSVIILHMSQLKYHNNLLRGVVATWMSNARKNGAEKEIWRVWIKQHKCLLRLYEEFGTIISPYLAMEFSYIFFHTCVPTFVITATLSWTTAQKTAVFFMVGGGLTTLFLMSVAGDSFSDEWQETGNVLFHEDVLPEDDGYMKHIYLMIQQRLKRPFRFSAFKVLPLNCITFLTIVRLIFSYYVTLSQIQKMKHNALVT